MSLLFQRQAVGTTSSDTWTHWKKVSANNNMYKTEVDLGMMRPHTQHAFMSVHKDSNPALSGEKLPAPCFTSTANNALEAVESSLSAPTEDDEKDGEVKVETRPIGKISALITRFNDVESRVPDATNPSKKFRIGLENVRKRYDTTNDKTSTSPSGQGDKGNGTPGSETSRLPIVELNFKLNTNIPSPKESALDTDISGRNRQLCLLKIPPKPSEKPKILNGPNYQSGLVYLQNTQPMGAHCIRPTEIRQDFPLANIELGRTDPPGIVSHTRENELGRTDPLGIVSHTREHKLGSNIFVQSVVSASQTDHKRMQPQNKLAVAACPTSIEPKVAQCPSSIEPTVAACPTSIQPTVGARPTSVDPIVARCPRSIEPTVAACPASIESTVVPCSASIEATVAACPASIEATVAACPRSIESTVAECPTSIEPAVVPCSHKDNHSGHTISAKLDMLKSELMAMRKMDLALLRQLINISQAIQSIQRSDLPKMSRSLTILSSRMTPQLRHRPVERQNSAPHCADRRRFLFSNTRCNTDEDYRDSLSSFDESEFDSQSELEESSSSLNSTTTSMSRPLTCPRVLFQSCSIPLSLDLSEEADQSYEDILKRNVRLWKMSFQRQQSLQEKLDVWF